MTTTSSPENQTNHHSPPESPPLQLMLQQQQNHTPNQLRQPPPLSESDSDPDSTNHITLSPSQLASPPHSDHITLSPHHSPDHSDSSSDHTSVLVSHRPSLENQNQTPHSDHISFSPPPHHENNKPTVYRNVAEQPVAIRSSVSLDKPVPVVEKTGAGGDVRRRFSPKLSILKRGGLGLRVLGFLFCLVSFAVMAADRNRGWAVDSFHRYIEFRYCMSVNVIGFVYSGAQAIHSSYNLATGKYISQHQQVRRYFDFTFDQIVAYLLISASSSAATRIDDWQSNWGKDKFPDMATGSVAMSFLAFVAIASSSLVSGYALCTSKSL